MYVFSCVANKITPIARKKVPNIKYRNVNLEAALASPQSVSTPISLDIKKPIRNQLTSNNRTLLAITKSITENVKPRHKSINLVWYLKPFK